MLGSSIAQGCIHDPIPRKCAFLLVYIVKGSLKGEFPPYNNKTAKKSRETRQVSLSETSLAYRNNRHPLVYASTKPLTPLSHRTYSFWSLKAM